MTDTLWLWVGFNVFILAMLALDLGVLHRKAHMGGFKESTAADENQFSLPQSVKNKFLSVRSYSGRLREKP